MNNKKYKKLFLLYLFVFNNLLTTPTQTVTLYKTTIPPFGIIEFSGTVNLEKKTFSLKGYPKKSVFDLGFLNIQNPFASISNNKGLTLQATVSLFNQTGTLALEEFVPKGLNQRSLFSITPKKEISLSTPWKTVSLNKFSLLITPENRELIANTTILGQDTKIAFGKEKTTNNNYAKIFFKELSPTQLSNNSNLDFVSFNNVSIKIENPFKKGIQHPTTISGIINIKLPGQLGNFSSEFNSEYNKNKLDIFVKSKKTINIGNGKIKLENTGIKIFSNGKLTISGNANILNTNITGYLTFNKLTPEEKLQTNIIKIGNYKVEFQGKAKDNKIIKPFANFNTLPNKIKNIEIQNPTIGLKSDKNFYLSGKTKILGFESIAEINIKGSKQASLKIKPPENWTKENLLKGKAFNQLDISNTYIIISSHPYLDKQLNQNINKGFNLISNIKILDNTQLSTLLGKVKQDLLLIGSFGTNLSDINLAVLIPVNVNLNNNITLQNISLVISGTGDLGVKSQIKLKKPNLIFTGYFGIDPKTASAEVQGTMQGVWENPLGLKGISISNTAIEFAISLTPPAPVPTEIGIAGKLNIGEVQGEAAIKISATGQGGIIASVNRLTLEDLLTIPAKLTPGINWNQLKKTIPNISISNVDIKAAMMAFKIGELNFESGINLKGEMNLLDQFQALVDCHVSQNGIIAKGTASEIKIGKILNITGAGFDGIYGNADDGPTVDLQLTPKNQKLMISGMGKLLGIEGQTDLYIGRNKLRFKTMYDILGSGMTLEGKSIGNINDLNSLDFKVHGQFKNELTQYIVNQIEKKLGSVAKTIAQLYEGIFIQISKVDLWVNLKDFVKGILPRIRIDIRALGKTFTIDEQLDLKKPHAMIWHLTKSILNGIQQFITSLPAEIAKQFTKAKDYIFNLASEIINIIKRGNVIFYNDTKFKIKIHMNYKLFGIKKEYDDIIIPANSVFSKMLQKDIRDMQLDILDNDGKWKNVNAWPGNTNIIDTYDYKTTYINFGYFPDDKELYKRYQTRQKFRRRIRVGNEIIKDWFSNNEKKEKTSIQNKKELIKEYFNKYLKRKPTKEELNSFLNWYPQKYSGIIDYSQKGKIKETDKKIESKIMRLPERKKAKINEWFNKFYHRKPTNTELNSLLNIPWIRDEIIETKIKSTAPQNRRKAIIYWIEKYTNSKANENDIKYYLDNWNKLKGIAQVEGRICNSQKALGARKNLIIKAFENYFNRKPTSAELEKYTRYRFWADKNFDFISISNKIKNLNVEKNPNYSINYHSANNKKDVKFIDKYFRKYQKRNPFVEEINYFIDLWNETEKTEQEMIESIKKYKYNR